MRHWGLRRKFVILFLVFITLPTVLFGFRVYYQSTVSLNKQAEKDLVSKLEKNEQILLSIIKNVESMTSYMIYDQDFRTFFTTAEEEMHRLKYKNAVKGINGYFTFQLMSNEYISSVYLEGKDGHSLRFGEPIKGNEGRLDRVAEEGEGAPVWSHAYRVTSDWDGEKHLISVSRIVNDLNRINDPIGKVRIRLDSSKLFKHLEANASTQTGQYFVVTMQGDVVIHHNPSYVGKRYPDPKLTDWAINGEPSSYNYETDSGDYLVVKKRLEGTNWISVAVVDEGELVKELHNVQGSVRNMVIVLFLLGMAGFAFFYQSNVKRIIALTTQIKQVENANFAASVDVNSSDEIGKLGMQFNKMVQNIKRYIDSEYKLKIKQKESELKALQSQMDPHFLYNTLDMIRWTARLENAMETGQLIEQLSKVFRMNVKNDNMWVLLEDELAYIQAYLELQKSRMGDRLDFSIVMDDRVKGHLVMKQMLQPLVENSIQHGFKQLPRQGMIYIRCYQANAQLWIDVIDNGWGFQTEDKTNDRHTGYALNNLKDRLNIAFGEKYGLVPLDTNEGAAYRLVLPLLNEEKLKEIQKETGE